MHITTSDSLKPKIWLSADGKLCNCNPWLRESTGWWPPESSNAFHGCTKYKHIWNLVQVSVYSITPWNYTRNKSKGHPLIYFMAVQTQHTNPYVSFNLFHNILKFHQEQKQGTQLISKGVLHNNAKLAIN